MASTILVPLDGSNVAEEAPADALALAQAAGARVVLMRALPPRRPGSATDEVDSIKRELEALAECWRGEGIRVDTIVQRAFMMDVGSVICAAAQDEQADLMVMSTHGRNGLGRWVYGSVADSVLRQAEVPVMLIHSQSAHGWPKERTMRILVPLDGSASAEQALDAAETLATILKAQLCLVRVVERPGNPQSREDYRLLQFDEDAELCDARAYLQGLVDRLCAHDKTTSMQAIVGQPSTRVPELARCIGADLIVMATHGRSALSPLKLGSVATSTILRADVPVLLVRPRTDEQAAGDRTDPARSVLGEPDAPRPFRVLPPVSVAENEFSDDDLQLVERALRALAFVPGYPQADVATGRTLAERLERAGQRESRDPVLSR